MNQGIQALKEWFLQQRRSLPWRENPTPYSVWVSEVMLQQTRASVVIPYFLHWMKLFPTVEKLAAAPLDEVIKAWEGLGYYSRARNLHAGAQFILQEWDGKIPNTAEELQRVKGLGPYTVGAILAFAFKKKAAAVDGNVLRVITRYDNNTDDITRSAVQRQIRERVQELLPKDEPWLVSEGLIELGATVCTRNPACLLCPLQSDCKAFAVGTATTLPRRKPRPKTEELHRWAGVVLAEEHALVQQGKEGRVMHDLYEFPYVPLEHNQEASAALSEHLTLVLEADKRLPTIIHGFTRYRVYLEPWIFRTKRMRPVEGYQWIPLPHLPQLAFSSGHKRLLHALLQSENIL